MTRFSTQTPKEQVLTHMEPVTLAISDSLGVALRETKRCFHVLGTPLVAEKPCDKSYFSHTMRYVAKRSLDEKGMQTRVEDEAENPYQLGQAPNTGIFLQASGIYARLLKAPLDEDLPRAGSDSRVEFYEQRQYKLPFPDFDGKVDIPEPDNAFHLVYAWDVDPEFTKVYLKLVCPNHRSGKHEWQHIFPAIDIGKSEAGSRDGAAKVGPQTSIAAMAAQADTDLDLSPRKNDKKEQVKGAVSKRA